MANERLVEVITLLTRVSSDLKDKVNNLEKKVASNTMGPGAGKGKILERDTPVMINEVSSEGKKDLAEAVGKGVTQNITQTDTTGAGFLSKLLGPGILILSGLTSLVAGLQDDKGLKGSLKLISMGSIKAGLVGLAKTFDPFINDIKTFVKNITGNLIQPIKSITLKTLGPSGFKFVAKAMTGILPVVKRIPGIGSLISWGFAYNRFQKGDVIGGLLDIGAGFAYLFPGIGTAIGIGIDVLNAFLDIKVGGVEGKKSMSINVSDWFKSIYNKMVNTFPLKNLKNLYDGILMVVNGDMKGGFGLMADAIPFFNTFQDFISGNVDASGIIDKASNTAFNMRETLKKIIGTVVTNFKKLIIKATPNILGARQGVAQLLGVNIDSAPELDINNTTTSNVNESNNTENNKVSDASLQGLNKMINTQIDTKALHEENNRLMKRLVAAIEQGALNPPIINSPTSIFNTNGGTGGDVRNLQYSGIK